MTERDEPSNQPEVSERDRRKAEIEQMLKPLRTVAMVLLLVAGGLILLLAGLCFNFFQGLPGVK